MTLHMQEHPQNPDSPVSDSGPVFEKRRHGARTPIPATSGIGLRHPHVQDFLDGSPDTGWLEVHSENYLSKGGPRLAALLDIRERYPVSCHGVGLSLGSAEGLDGDHLDRLADLFDMVQPGLVSEHVSWSVHDGVYMNDLLPLPYTEESLDVLCRNIDRAQTRFGRRILIENPSSYIAFAHSTIPEAVFVAEASKRTGCGILLDVNNIYVSAHNHALDPIAYILDMPKEAVQEIHLAGHSERAFESGGTLLIDDHGSRVPQAVLALYRVALEHLQRPVPTLIEWDSGIPDLAILLDEAAKATAVGNAVFRNAGNSEHPAE